MKTINDIIQENMNYDAFQNIKKCIEESEQEPAQIIRQYLISPAYHNDYDTMILYKNINTNKVTNVLIEQSKSPYNTKRIDFDILPTKDKETIDRNIQIK